MLRRRVSAIDSSQKPDAKTRFASPAAFTWFALILVSFIGISIGCRSPLPKMSNGTPSFDGLIELEQRSASGKLGRYSQHPGEATKSIASTANFSDEASDFDADQEELNEWTQEGMENVPLAYRELIQKDSAVRSGRRNISSESEASSGRGKQQENSAPDPQVALNVAVRKQITDSNDPSDQTDAMALSDRESKSTALQLAKQSASELATLNQSSSSRAKASSRHLSDSTSGVVTANAVKDDLRDRLADETNEDGVNNAVVTASYTGSRPSPEAETLGWRQHIEKALEQLDQESQTLSPSEQLQLQMISRWMHMSLGDLNAAMEPVEGLQTDGQEFVRHSLHSLFEVANPQGNPIELKRYTLAMLSQRKAMEHLSAVSNLEIHNAGFCEAVEGFGVVSKFAKYQFKADQELLLYCELDNFVSTVTDGKGFETQLQGSYEIVDSGGRRVADQLLPMDSHLCRNRRRDYFIAYRIYMPQNIDRGRYQLKLVIEDMKGRKFGQSSIDFEIID